MTAYTARSIDPAVLKDLRTADDADRPMVPFADEEGGAPLRCCLRRSEPDEVIALVSYAPLRRWAAETGADPGAYDEQGPVFIHADDCPGPDLHGYPFPGAHRTVRRYSAEGHILGGRLVENPDENPDSFDEAFDEAFAEAFADPEVASVHVRAVEYGCFLYEVRRA
ncbi:DUF1203 domain-containing protein [Streptomyces sp. NBC_01136]|uniref:DUF1203 domain-containing protein n=1 Tax=Streptomyces sp. NBC_01136 TaxID=2903754 RepID=UPI00386F9DF9|nr:DUF1203 domain-containing protein [Streptomyces sp. NBC_01136]